MAKSSRLDAKGSKVATHVGRRTAPDSADRCRSSETTHIIIYTDITKDGMMSGPNFERTKALVEAVDVPVIASGGVNTIEDIQKLAEFNPEAAIIGRSLYEGTLKLVDAIKAAKES
jgi:phosphoribosylformimino-5-aminoimidazole carboxamide ribotide isomerase